MNRTEIKEIFSQYNFPNHINEKLEVFLDDRDYYFATGDNLYMNSSYNTLSGSLKSLLIAGYIREPDFRYLTELIQSG